MNIIKLLIAAAAFALAANANATLTLQLSDTADFSSNVVTVTDTSGTAGFVSYSDGSGTLFNGWTFVSTTGISSPYTTGGSELDLFPFTLANTNGTGTIYIRLSQTDYTGAGHLVSLLGGTTAGTVSVSSYLDASNTLFGTGTMLYSGTGLTGGFSGSSSTAIGLASPYSMTVVAAITANGAATTSTTSFDFNMKVPEPGTLSLLGIGLLAIGFTVRRKQAA